VVERHSGVRIGDADYRVMVALPGRHDAIGALAHHAALMPCGSSFLHAVDQAFSRWYYHRARVIVVDAYFLVPVQKGGLEMPRSAGRATSISSMTVWSCIEDDPGV
jgi:hypothetical protein